MSRDQHIGLLDLNDDVLLRIGSLSAAEDVLTLERVRRSHSLPVHSLKYTQGLRQAAATCITTEPNLMASAPE